MPTTLDYLKETGSVIVADTADFNKLKAYKPQDGTTNPSLVLAGSKLPEYAHLVDDAIAFGKKKGGTAEEVLDWTVDKLTVNFGLEILKIIPGRVSSEVDAKYSFDTAASVEKARRIAQMYADAGKDPKQYIYIKLASTWQGIQAAKILEKEGLRCNLTLLFSFAQAVACAQANVSLISPFVGRIMDYYKAKRNVDGFAAAEDPGVQSVTKIYNYYKAYGYNTIVMGASFRNTSEITELAGCDNITISPALLQKLQEQTDQVPKKLDSKNSKKWCDENNLKKLQDLTESDFLFLHNEDEMAVEKLAQGIRSFNADTRVLEKNIMEKIKAVNGSR